MCGRYAREAKYSEIYARYHIVSDDRLTLSATRYNICIGTHCDVVVEIDGERRLVPMHWSFTAPWSNGPDSKYKTFNARDDTIATSKLYRPSFERKRCIVPATGFYEWRREAHGLQPYFFYLLPQYGLFSMAGLWSYWKSKTSDDELYSFAIVTTTANELVSAYHAKKRMPAILHEEDEARWLDPNFNDLAELQKMLKPWPDNCLTCHPVSRGQLRPGNEGPLCVAPVMPEGYVP